MNYKILNADEFLTSKTIQPEWLINWLANNHAAMIYSKTGVGKTNFCLGLATAISTGKPFLKWNTKESKCLYVDGEMQADAMKKRMKTFFKNDSPKNFYLFSHENIDKALYIEDELIQEIILKFCKENKIELVVLDNLSTLSNSNRNSAKAFMNNIAPFIKTLRKNKIAVILIHHSNKSGKQAGSYANDLMLDVVIQLEKHKNGIEIIFSKSRHLTINPAENIIYEVSKEEGLKLITNEFNGNEIEKDLSVIELPKEESLVLPAQKQSYIGSAVKIVASIFFVFIGFLAYMIGSNK